MKTTNILLMEGSPLYESFTYPAGEVQVRLTQPGPKILQESEKVRIISRLQGPELAHNTSKTLHLIDAVYGAGNGSQFIELVLPYLPYSRADRRFTEGDCHGLRTFLRQLSNSPVGQITTLDVHSGEAECICPILHNIEPVELINKAIDDVLTTYQTPHLIVLLPDEGARSRYESMIKWPFVELKNCTKKRDPKTGKLLYFEVPEIEDRKPVLLVDDLCDGGGTFLGIADIPAAKRWFFKPSLYVTHGVFSKGLEELASRFHRIYTTNSFDQQVHRSLTTYDCMPVLLKQ